MTVGTRSHINDLIKESHFTFWGDTISPKTTFTLNYWFVKKKLLQSRDFIVVNICKT